MDTRLINDEGSEALESIGSIALKAVDIEGFFFSSLRLIFNSTLAETIYSKRRHALLGRIFPLSIIC